MATDFFSTAEGRALQALPQIFGRLTKPFEAPAEIGRLAQAVTGQRPAPVAPPAPTQTESRGSELEQRAAEGQQRTQEAEQTGQQQRAGAQSGTFDAQARSLELLSQILRESIDPALLQRRADIDAALYERQVKAANEAAMAQTRELTQRALERDTINAWSNITQKQIDRDTQLAVGMMSLSATLGMPNPNVLQGMAAAGASAAKAYSPVPALY